MREASSKDAATCLGPGKGGPPSIILKGTGLEESLRPKTLGGSAEKRDFELTQGQFRGLYQNAEVEGRARPLSEGGRTCVWE